MYTANETDVFLQYIICYGCSSLYLKSTINWSYFHFFLYNALHVELPTVRSLISTVLIDFNTEVFIFTMAIRELRKVRCRGQDSAHRDLLSGLTILRWVCVLKEQMRQSLSKPFFIISNKIVTVPSGLTFIKLIWTQFAHNLKLPSLDKWSPKWGVRDVPCRCS
jgi:hypothetical protein